MQLLSQPAFTWARILNTGHCRSQPSGSCSPDRSSNIPVGRKSVELRNKQKQTQTHQEQVSHRDVWIKFSCKTVPWLGWKCKRFNHNLNVFHLVCLNLFNTHKLKRADRQTQLVVVVVVAFSSCLRIFGRMFDNSLPASPFFLIFLKWRLVRAHWFHSLGQDQSTMAKRAETTVTECSLTSCVWTRFLIDSHTMPGQRHSQPTPTSLGQRCMRV